MRTSALQSTIDAAIAVLCTPELAPIVDMVCAHPEPDTYLVTSADGSVRFRRSPTGFQILEETGTNPLANQATDQFVGLAAELAHPHPTRSENAYPHAFASVAQLFDHPHAPDLCVLHTAAHHWGDQGGHLGEHGSLDIVQTRAPLVFSGAGITPRGLVGASAQLIDVAPTVAALLGVTPHPDGSLLAGQDGRVLREVLADDAPPPDLVIGALFDGTNANVLYEMAGRGEAPTVARLIEAGFAFGHGAFASLPSVTLANHTTILTGRHPGHHGILHNAWFDRDQGVQIITNSQDTWPWAMHHLLPGVESLFDAVHRTWPDAATYAVDEPADAGATWSTFEYFRRGEVPPIPESPLGLPHTTERFVRPSKDYAWASIVDHMAVDPASGILRGAYLDTPLDRPRLLWVNFTLTDAAMHEGGPYSEVAAAGVRDSDARLGAILDVVEEQGWRDSTAVVLVADHGMEQTDPTVGGDWDVVLREAGFSFRDEGYGFLYFD